MKKDETHMSNSLMYPMKNEKSNKDTASSRCAKIRSARLSMLEPVKDVQLICQDASVCACRRIPSEKEVMCPQS